MNASSYIEYLTKNNYHPYTFTMNFFRCNLSPKYNDSDLFYSNKPYYNTSMEDKIMMHAKTIEKLARISFYALTKNVIRPRRITNKSSNKFIPLFFYEFDIMKKMENTLLDVRHHGYNISPVHLHGTVFIPNESMQAWDKYIGKNTLLKDNKERNIKGIQASLVEPIYSHDGWFNYSHKKIIDNNYKWSLSCMNSSFEWAYPDCFTRNPDEFLSHAFHDG
jgi:hypothetical protein